MIKQIVETATIPLLDPLYDLLKEVAENQSKKGACCTYDHRSLGKQYAKHVDQTTGFSDPSLFLQMNTIVHEAFCINCAYNFISGFFTERNRLLNSKHSSYVARLG